MLVNCAAVMDAPFLEIKMNTCLNCLYEPEWGDWCGGEYPRQSGACRWDGVIPVLPSHYYITKSHIIRHSDDSGVKANCKAWKLGKQISSGA